MADQPAFSTTGAKAPGCLSGSLGLLDGFGRTAKEVFSIALIADVITEFTGKEDDSCLSGHWCILRDMNLR
jgi:hypothetical protein